MTRRLTGKVHLCDRSAQGRAAAVAPPGAACQGGERKRRGRKAMERPRILVVGGGFAGLECARRLERKLTPAEADIALVAPFSYQLYLPLLPHVAAGVVTPQSVAISLRRVLRRTRVVPGGSIGIDAQSRACVVRLINDELVVERYDYLVLAPGSITRTFDIPGLTDYARGVKTLAEAA